MAFLQLVGLRSPRAGRGAAHAWIILAEDGQPGQGDQIWWSAHPQAAGSALIGADELRNREDLGCHGPL
jgi:hypothetical protein